MVQQGIVLAIEAAEGTDAMLARTAGPCCARAEAGVLVKARKPQQDRRFDLPVIGRVDRRGRCRGRPRRASPWRPARCWSIDDAADRGGRAGKTVLGLFVSAGGAYDAVSRMTAPTSVFLVWPARPPATLWAPG